MVREESQSGETAGRLEVPEAVADLRSLLESQKLVELLDYWTGLREAPGEVPAKTRLDPAAVPRLLPGIMLVERRGEGFHTRVAGTDLRKLFDLEFTGRDPLEALPPTLRGVALRSYQRALGTGRPLLVRALYAVGSTGDLLYERLVLPLCDEESERRFLLIGLDWRTRPQARPFSAEDFARLTLPHWRREYEQA